MIKRLMIVINVLKYIFELKYNTYNKTNSTLIFFVSDRLLRLAATTRTIGLEYFITLLY